jgi:uncharacterized NAD-dependent epimerase/dehydratase family protein
MPRRRLLILAEGHFGKLESKTANCVIRYRGREVVGVIDSRRAGKTVQRVLGFGGKIPVVGSLREGLALRPTDLLIGVAPQGGMIEPSWERILLRALRAGLNVVNGLHVFLSENARFQKAARAGGAKIFDLRKYDRPLRLPKAKPPRLRAKVLLTVGSDCNVGKMTAAWEAVEALRALGLRVGVVATGQTGIYLAGKGVPVDAIKSDFIAGATEEAIEREARRAQAVVVEGQGSLNHPAYSGVALGLLHGSRADALLFCHEPGRACIDGYPTCRLPSLATLVRRNEEVAAMVKPAPVVAVALNSARLSDARAKAALREAQTETRLPAVDPIRFGRQALARVLRETLS